jgi:hypothetical protein
MALAKIARWFDARYACKVKFRVITPFKDDLSQHDLHSSFNTYPFEDAYLIYEDSQPLCSDFEDYQDMATAEQSEIHPSKHKYFILGDFHQDFQGKRWCFSTPETIPYLLPSSPRDHALFFQSFISSQSSTSSESLCADEDEPSSTYSIPLQRWIDQTYDYTFRQNDRANGFSFQQDFLPPTHLHQFYFMIDYMCFYTHDYYLLDLSLLYYIINHMGRYFDEMIKWLHWLYDFT